MSSTQQTNMFSPYTLSATFLVAGTCIGGGMLALPVACAKAGFWPSIATMALTCIMMTLTALCLVEIGFWVDKEDAHIVSMSRKFFGPIGRYLSWTLFLFISYASLVAYIGGSGQILRHTINTFTSGVLSISHEMSCLLFVLLFGPFIFLSHYILGKANSSLFILMILTYVAVIGIGITCVDPALLTRMEWNQASTAIPLLLTSFSFQTIVPSLHTYLQHDKKSLQTAIISGTSIAFLTYTIWQFVVLGSIPLDGPFGLLDAYSRSQPATYSLNHLTESPSLMIFSMVFAFLSLVTSFFGISMGLYDFLSDGMNVKKQGYGTLLLGSLVLLPSLYFAMYFEGAFLTALDLSGAFGDTILNGLIPIAMMWTGWKLYTNSRIKKRLQVALLGLAALYAAILFSEITHRIQFGDTTYDNRATDIIDSPYAENEYTETL